MVLAACGVFALLPFMAATLPAWLFVPALFVWLICSSVMRVPPLVLLAKHTTPQQTAGPAVAAYLFGLGVAGALAPYLTVYLKNLESRLPFVLASVALSVSVLALRVRLVAPASADTPAVSAPAPARVPIAWPLLLAFALIAFGMQLHAAVNSAKFFVRSAPGMPLEWLMPLFWAGFSIAMFPASRWLARGAAGQSGLRAAADSLWLSGLIGGSALLACATAPPLWLLIALQVIAGAAWAMVFLAAIAMAAELGRTGREGRWIGATLALIALATVGRIALVLMASPAGGGAMGNAISAQLPWLSAVAWLVGAMLLALPAVKLRRARHAARAGP
jgi:hypothetical protein